MKNQAFIRSPTAVFNVGALATLSEVNDNVGVAAALLIIGHAEATPDVTLSLTNAGSRQISALNVCYKEQQCQKRW